MKAVVACLVLLLSSLNIQARELTLDMLKNEDEVCDSGAPTKEELKVLLSNSTYIDNQIKTMPDAYHLILLKAAEAKGMTIREALIDDASTAAAKKWEETCTSKY